jgi:hypothetical protein
MGCAIPQRKTHNIPFEARQLWYRWHPWYGQNVLTRIPIYVQLIIDASSSRIILTLNADLLGHIPLTHDTSLRSSFQENIA